MTGHKNQQDPTMFNGDTFWFKTNTFEKFDHCCLQFQTGLLKRDANGCFLFGLSRFHNKFKVGRNVSVQDQLHLTL